MRGRELDEEEIGLSKSIEVSNLPLNPKNRTYWEKRVTRSQGGTERGIEKATGYLFIAPAAHRRIGASGEQKLEPVTVG